MFRRNFPVGTNIVSCTATDSAGNAATCSFKVTVQDREPPVLVCPPDVTVNTDPGQCGVAFNHVSLGAPSVSDNCGVASVVVRTRIRFGVGTSTVTWVATDGNGNGAQCLQKVTVVDVEPPVITLVGANPLAVECHTTFTDPGATADDICAGAVAVTSSGNVDVNTPGSYTITYSATDPSGNTATATRTVNVVDSVAPIIALNGANPLIVPCHVPFTDPGATATDACAGSVSVSASGTVDVNTPGDYALTYSATDPSGNTATATRTVSVVCGTPTLAITCPPDVNVSNDPGQCSAVANYPAPVVSGGIGSVTVVCNPPSGSSFPVGTNVVNCTATDSAGNTATCSFNVVVNDTEAPVPSMVATAPPVRYQNPPRVVNRVQLFATDNCDPDPFIYIGGSQSQGFVAGPFHRGDKVTLIHGPNLTPGSRKPRDPNIAAEITFNGDPLIWSADSAGNVSAKVR
ncbi:MAG: DUF5011 domain-containing protein [Verrucomicrobia bacterium]|nr:DUF5011 domain-containing protein [Verrucomicrobiota bacterium]